MEKAENVLVQIEQAEASLVKLHNRKFPVVEIFGPTIQGEGVDQGVPCYFIRFGGCDYKCVWCDSPHAVLPNLVRHAPRMNVDEIVQEVARIQVPGPRWVVLSGGNPCLHELEMLVSLLKSVFKFQVALETQGTVWKRWIWQCDRVCVSPKPPSSGHETDFGQLGHFLEQIGDPQAFLKVVVFNHRDYLFARTVHYEWPELKMCVSAGNDSGATVGDPENVDNRNHDRIALDLIASGRWLANRVMADPDMHDVRVQVQQHVLYWGNDRGR